MNSHRTGLGLALVGLLSAMMGCGADDQGLLIVSGTIEADEVRVSTTVGGQVAEVLVREGDAVTADQVLLRFDPTDLELQADQARAAVRMATAQAEMARNGARSEDIAAARELVKQAEMAQASAAADMERVKQLADEGAATGKQNEDATTRHDLVSSQKRAAQQQYNKALRGARAEELEMAEAGLAQTEAALALLEKKIGDCQVIAPRSGTLVHRLVEPGEVSGPGGTLFVIQDLETVRLTVFVPESDIGRVRLGDAVSVYLDSHPDDPFPGTVTRIRQQAEFTPKNVQTKDERVKLVFGVEVEMANTEGYLKPGLPADARFDDAASSTQPAATAENSSGAQQ